METRAKKQNIMNDKKKIIIYWIFVTILSIIFGITAFFLFERKDKNPLDFFQERKFIIAVICGIIVAIIISVLGAKSDLKKFREEESDSS